MPKRSISEICQLILGNDQMTNRLNDQIFYLALPGLSLRKEPQSLYFFWPFNTLVEA